MRQQNSQHNFQHYVKKIETKAKKKGFLKKKKEKKKRVAGHDEYLNHAFYKRSFFIRVSLFHTSMTCTIKEQSSGKLFCKQAL